MGTGRRGSTLKPREKCPRRCLRHLPDYQINWSAVHDVVRQLQREFQKLRRIAGKCLPLVTHEEQRRIIRELAEHIDQKIDYCRSMSG